MRAKSHAWLWLASLAFTPLVAAHPLHGHGDAWSAFLHPFFGIDHVSAMIVIGVWAALAPARLRWLPPLTFVAGLAGGAALGASGVQLFGMETAMALSVLVLGPVAACAARLPAAFSFTLCALAGLCHGYAHGAELVGQGLAGASFILGSVVLHGVGYSLALRANAAGFERTVAALASASGMLGLWLLGAP